MSWKAERATHVGPRASKMWEGLQGEATPQTREAFSCVRGIAAAAEKQGGGALFWEGTLVGVEAENPLETVARRQEATELNRVGCGHWSPGTDESQGSWGGDPELNPCSGSHKEA